MKLVAFTDVSDAARLALHVVVSWLPWRVERRLADAIAGGALGRTGGLHDRVVAGLTDMLGSDRSTEEVAALARANIAHRWTERELVWLWRMAWSARRRRVLTRAVEIEGLEHLRAAVARGGGAILLEAHLGKRVLGREALRQAGFEIRQVHAHDHGGAPTRVGQHGLRRLHRFLARRAGVEVLELDPASLAYLRTLLDRLRRNEILAFASLGTFGSKFVAVDAIGTTLAVPTGIASLARASGAALLPLFVFADDAGREHVVVETPLAAPAAGDAGLIAWAHEYAALLARYVRRHPAQWFWWYELPDARTLPAAVRRLDRGA